MSLIRRLSRAMTVVALAATVAYVPTSTEAITLRHIQQSVQYQSQSSVTSSSAVWLGVAIRACQAVRCYRWWPKKVAREFQYGHITPAVKAFLRAWFCSKTFIC